MSTTTREDHARAARKIVAAMVKHPIKHDGIPSKDINAGFHPEMVQPIWDDLDIEIKEIHTNTSKTFDVEFVIAIPSLRELRNTRSLELYDFQPTFHKYKPVDYGVHIEFSGMYEDEHLYGFNIYLGSVDFTPNNQ